MKTSIPHTRQSCTAVVAAVLLLAAAGCSTRNGVAVSRDEGVDFSRFTTWSWLSLESVEDERPRGETERRLSELVQRQIHRELHGRGYRYQARNADLGIGSRLIIEHEKHIINQTTAIETLHSLHNGPSIQVQATRSEFAIYQRCRLTIRATDLERDRVVWRGVYEDRFRDSIEPQLEDVVVRTLSRFPPTERPDRSPGNQLELRLARSGVLP